MDFAVRLFPPVTRQISQWGLSEIMLVEVYLALREVLPQAPMQHLHRDVTGSGCLFVFSRRDPAAPNFRSIFMFRVFFDEDEKHLNIVRGSYWRDFAPSTAD